MRITPGQPILCQHFSSVSHILLADLVLCAPQFTNPLREREIKLRAYKIPAIENLGSTQDQFDTIDLSDNEIRKLEVSLVAFSTFSKVR